VTTFHVLVIEDVLTQRVEQIGHLAGMAGMDPVILGGGEKEETAMESAKRELKEETGLKAEDWSVLLKIHTSNSVTDEVGYVYLARDLTQGETEFDDTEDLKIWYLPFQEAYQMVLDGKITDAISMAAIFKTSVLLKG
jgi:8-oxo-dGTP pyrophosphatase MutT (NUDIX family)